MKVLKKQGLMLMLIAALVVTLTLGIIFMLPARTAMAEEDYTLVTTETEIQDVINASSDENPAYVKLDGDISLTGPFAVSRYQNVTIDLNGHTLTGTNDSNPRSYATIVFNEWGTVSFIDTSAKRTGLITSSYYSSMIDNRGSITFDVNIDASETPYFRHTMTLSSEGEFVCTPTMTFKGGTISLPDNGPAYDSIAVRDANVKIEGGTFISNTSSVFSISTFVETGAKISGDDEAAVQTDIEKRKAHFDTVAAHRGSKIEITGGNFSTLDGYYDCLMDLSYSYTVQTDIKFYDTYNGAWSDSVEGTRGNAEYSVEISGGTWGFDPSAYLAPGYWTKEDPDAQGMYIIEKAKENEAVAEANGSYFTTFEAAWATAQGRTAMGKDTEIKLKANCETTTLNFPESEEIGKITIDLNGFTLSVTQSAKNDYHIYGYNKQREQITLVVRDGSVEQSGELKLIYLKDAEKGGIYLSDYCKFVLESGTIRRTGGPLKAVREYSSESEEYEYKAYRTMFRLNPAGDTQGSNLSSHYEENMVVIKGGSIVSELTGEEEWNEADRKMSFVCFEYGYNGYSSYQSTQYCLKIEPDTDYGKDEDKYYSSFTPAQDDSKTLATQKRMQVVRFDLEALDTYLDGTGKGCRFSWDLKVLAPDLVWTPSNGGYIVTKQKEGDNYSVDGMDYATFAEALNKATAGDTIFVLYPDLVVSDENVVLDGVTLDLNTYLRHAITFTNGLTLKNGAAIKNGVVKGGTIIVDAHAEDGRSALFEKAELQCALTVNANADLVISDGTYAGAITVQSGANLLITGGSFKGSEIENLDQYFGEHLGAFDLANKDFDYQTYPAKLYSVQFGPDIHAQEWYKGFSGNEYEIGTTDNWLSFSLFVNSGLDNFNGKTVKLTADLSFDPNAKNGIALAAEAKEPNFLPAGNATYTFQGSLDGGNHTIENIVAQEKFVGLFGRTTGKTVVKDLTLKNSTFTVGSGTLDAFNKGTSDLYGGAIIGEAYNGSDCTNVTIEGVTVDQADIVANVMSGAVVGHSWGDITVTDLTMSDTALKANWKLGGVVGFTEGSVVIKNSTITDITLEGSLTEPGVVAGHLSYKNTTSVIENCVIYTPDLNLIGLGYAGDKTITIDGAETYINVYAIVGNNSTHEAEIGIEFSKEVTEEGVKRTTVITHTEEDNITFTENGKDITDQIEQNADGGFEAVAKLDVTIGKIVVPAMTYSATEAKEATLTSFVLYNELGNELTNDTYGYLNNLQVVVTLQLSKSTVGKQMALITSYTITGADANKYTFQLTGNQTFIEVDVTAKTLQVSVNGNGEVEYDGFVGGENESVLGGSLTLDKVDNGDGTYTVTPSGLESENYNIVYVSSVVPAAAFETESNALWIALAVVGSAVLLLGAFAVVYAVVRKRSS